MFFFVAIVVFGVFWSSPEYWSKKISLDVLDLFPQGNEREWVDLNRKFSDSKTIYVSKKDARDFDTFISDVALLPNVATVHQGVKPNLFFQEFLSKNYFYLGVLRANKMEPKEMLNTLLQSASSPNFNPLDPLKIIEIPQFAKDFVFENEPYVVVQMKSADAKKVHLLYEEFTSLAQKYGIKHYFSPLFIGS